MYRVHSAITRLFQLGRYPELSSELLSLNERLVKLSKSDIGPFLGEFYQVSHSHHSSAGDDAVPPQDQLLKKCMIILREEIREEKGAGTVPAGN